MPLRWHAFAETVHGRIDHPVPPRPLAEIDADLEKQVAKILDLLHEVEQ